MAIPLDPRFIPAFSIEDVLLDKDTGEPLSGGLVYFEIDDQRGVLKPVYQITGTSPNYTFTQLPNPMVLSSIGTFEDALDAPVIPYFYPYKDNGDVELYYVRVTNFAGVPQFTRQAQPYISSGSDSPSSNLLENEISNPQFAEILFNSPTTFSFNAVANEVISIAPGWDLVVSSPGVGSVTLTQITPAGSANIVTNPGTLLNISSSSLSKLQLRQRIFGSPNLWGSGNLASSFIAKTYSGTSPELKMYYSQSNGTVVDQLLVSASLPSSGDYESFPDSKFIPESDSTEEFPDAYIDIYFDIPLSIQIDISSVMLSFTDNEVVEDIIYEQDSLDRQVDHLFHYYNPRLQYKPIPSYTVGWDFMYNPCQELGTVIAATALGANKSRYIADQTIAFEEVSNALSYTIDSIYLTVSTTATTQFALIQYLDRGAARELLSQRESMCLRGFTNAGTIEGIASLYYTTSGTLPTVTTGTNNSIVATMIAGKPATLNGAGWTEVGRSGLGNAKFTLGTSIDNFHLSGFDATSGNGSSTAEFFAIVVSFNAMPSTQTVSLQFCTLNAGDISTPPPALSFRDTLSNLEAYYEKSNQPGYNPGSIYTYNQLTCPMAYTSAFPGNTSLYVVPFGVNYRSPKRITIPNVYVYSPDTGAFNTVRGHIYTNAVSRNSFDIPLTEWVVVSGNKGFYCLPFAANLLGTTATVSPINPNTNITFQYVGDGRFGIV